MIIVRSPKFIFLMLGLAMSGYVFMVDWPDHWEWVLSIVAVVSLMFVLWYTEQKR